ncbi:hypothetical protein TI39_contig262g00010 [Zymoseptoria brevis]|uniref:Uncharacterized protein n=1 Tax=Zymoseptoria brevis TaxID=1047168 RepID=A0A0F4GXA8_9PEZI|nr:hypothetical protein TI39_contig262g00010 [Zymoseptoria brevis]
MAIITFLSTMERPTTAVQAPVLVTEADIQEAPMSADHKEIVLMHHRRLVAQLPGEFSARQQSALDRLVRITLIFRDYNDYRAKLPASGQDGTPATIESMIVDVLDACIPICGVTHPMRLPESGASPREYEVRRMVRQYNNFHSLVEDITRRARALSKVVPDRHTRVDMAEGIDWPKKLKRSRSANDIFQIRFEADVKELAKRLKIEWEEKLRQWHARPPPPFGETLSEREAREKEEKRMKEEIEERVEDERKRERDLIVGKLADLSLLWPPGKGEKKEGLREQ